MTDRPTFWERIGDCPLWRLMAFVFLFALSERVIVTLIFFTRWGWHTVSGIELWFYYGVAKGTFDLYSVWDPTWWILKTLGALLSGPALLYGTYLVSSLSSSLNAALFCLFVSELHNKKTGFLAGLLYGSMVLPMFNSAGTVTHDIFAYPYLILSLYGGLMFFKRKGPIKILFAFICLASLFLGKHVGPTIMVGGGCVVVYLLWQGIQAFLSPKPFTRYAVLGAMLVVAIPLVTLGYKELSYVSKTIYWEYTADYLGISRKPAGQKLSVSGKIIRVDHSFSNGEIRLYFDKDNPDAISIKIPPRVARKLSPDQADSYNGKTIIAYGKIDDNPQPVLLIDGLEDLHLVRYSFKTIYLTAIFILGNFIIWQVIRIIAAHKNYRWGAAVITFALLPLVFFIYHSLIDTTSSVTWRSEYLAKSESIRGRVESAHQISRGEDLYLRLQGEDKHPLSIMIPKAHLTKFPYNAATCYTGRVVRAGGQVSWGTNPVLIVTNPDALKISTSGTWTVIIIIAAILLFFLFWHLFFIRRGFEYLPFVCFLVMITGLLVLLYLDVMPVLMQKTFNLALGNRGINVLSQIKAGSGDLLASSLGDYWLRFNFLLFFLPVGIWIAVKKKDMLGFALIMVAFLASRTADRGTRPLTFGFALMGALAFVNWRPIYGWLLALWMCFIIGEFGGKYSTEYAVFFPAAALFIFYSIQWPRQSRRSLFNSIVLFLSLFGILAGFIILLAPGLRESMGFLSLPHVPGGLLRTASGFSYLFIVFSLATIGILLYPVKLWITDNRAPKWIWAIFSLTALWLLAGSFLGGAIFQAKQLGNPEILKRMDGIKSLTGQPQVAAVNAIMVQIKLTVEAIRKYWTVQICLIVPGLLLLLESIIRRPRPPRKRKERKKSNAYQWFNNTVVKSTFIGAVGLLAVLIIMVLLTYVGFIQGEPIFTKDGTLFSIVHFSWENIKYFFPAIIGVIIFILIWPRRAEKDRQYLTGVAVVCWLFATIIPSMNQTAKSTEGEYRAYKWLDDHARGKGKVFVPWSDGYLAEAVSGLTSELSPENIDFQLPRLYWLPEEAAARSLKSKGLDYLLISSKYFKLLRYNKKTGEFQYSFSPDIIYQPQQMGINNMKQLQQTTLYRLLYQTRDLKHFRLLHYERDPAVNEAYLIYRVIP